MATVLQIAAGVSAEALADAAKRTGETQADVLDAARFYLREILFYQGADAYRMLGLAHDAGPEKIRSHYRLLQQWLHPDRHTSDWDAIFASRVNIAWNQLRTPAKRAEYDAQLPSEDRGSRSRPSRSMSASLAPTSDASMQGDGDSWHRDRWRRRAPVLALGAVCVLLGIAAVRDMQRTPDGGLDQHGNFDAPAEGVPPSVVLQVPKRSNSDIAKVVIEPKKRPRRVTPVLKPEARVRLPQQVLATVATPARVPVQTSGILPAAKPMAIAPHTTQSSKQPQLASAKPAPIAVSTEMPVAMEPARPAVASVAVVKPATPSASPHQVWQAQQTGKQLLAFVSSRSNLIPPIWDSPGVQARAIQMRTALQDSGAVRGGESHWRVGETAAAMSTQMQAGNAQQQLRVALVWREQRWLVSSLALEQLP
ncbi:MAG: DnaJ domain-containing protein [Thermomonas sp.]